MYKSYFLAGFLIFITCGAWSMNSFGPGNGVKEEVNIYRKVYDAPLMGTADNTTLYQLAQNKPILLALIFTRCSNICYPFLLNLKEALQTEGQSGAYQVLVLSFDPRDSIAELKALAKRFGLEKEPQWTFRVTSSIDELNNSIGFAPIWDPARQQFDHDALLVGINSEGYITKKLIGIRNSADLSQLIRSINNGFTPTYRLPGQNQLFSCFNYNPKTGKNTPGTGLLFIALPAILTVAILAGIRLFVKQT